MRGEPEQWMFLLEELDGRAAGTRLTGRRKASRNSRVRELVSDGEVRQMSW